MRTLIVAQFLAFLLIPLAVGTSCSSDSGAVESISIEGDVGVQEEGGEDAGTSGPTETTSSSTGETEGNATTETGSIAITHTLTLDPASELGEIRTLLGVNGGPLGSASDTIAIDTTAQLKQLGVTLIRTHDFDGPLDMATIYPDTTADPALESSYDFSVSDDYFASIVNGGFDVYLRVGDSAGTAAGFPAKNPRTPANFANWAQAAVHVVGHYTDTVRWGRNAVRYVEVWNEPDSTHFWDADLETFYDFFAQATTALKAAYPDMMIGGPGLTHRSYAAPLGQTWFQGLLSYCRDQGAPLDFLSWHTYTNDPEILAAAAIWYRQQLDGYGFAATEIHTTEWNTDAHESGLSSSDIQALRNGGRGAALNTAGWIRLQENAIAVSTFYRARDPQFDNSEFYGLLDRTGKIKPVALAFGLWTELANQYATRVKLTTETTSGTTLFALAGKAADGRIAILLANPSSASLGVNIAGLDGSAAISRVSDAADLTQQLTRPANAVDLPAYSVMLVTLP